MSCPCRHHPHPRPLDIAPGLTQLPRLVASYGEFRRAMLSDATARSVLSDWTAREPGDLGVLAIEMWALACEIVAFADETICHECFIRTARLDDSARRLIALLGYRPRPAVAATVDVSFQVDGRNPVTLPLGLGLRSGAIGEHPPQVFELLAETITHPLANRFAVRPSPVFEIAETSPGAGVAEFESLSVLVVGPGLVNDALVLVTTPTSSLVRRIDRVVPHRGPGPQRRTLRLSSPVQVPAGTAWDDLTVDAPSLRVGLWTLDVSGFTQPGVSTSSGVTTLTLDALHRRFGAGQTVVLERAGHARWFTIDRVEETTFRLAPNADYSTDEGDYTLPGATAPVTRLVLDDDIDDARHREPGDTASWGDAQAPEISVYGGWTLAGTFETPDATEMEASTGTIDVGDGLDTPWDGYEPARFTVFDRDGRSVTAAGSLDWDTGEIDLPATSWDPPLRHPIRVEANVATATRGETVVGEVLGSGDAARINQVFTLANQPLTYLGPSASGASEVAKSTLAVWVDGVRWDEVPHFVGTGPADRVYVVRHTDDGGTEVHFGDGGRGARLTTGVDNVVADYRWGAGDIHPEAGSISQMVEPVAGVSSVTNRGAAFGGSGAASADEIRVEAPRSALLLGRIVSRADAAAAARETAGVVTAAADWSWSPDRLDAGIVVRYIGDPALAAGLRSRLRSLVERDVRIDAVVSNPTEVAVTVTLTADARRRPGDVRLAVIEALVRDGGTLTPAVLGIDGPIYRSRLVASVMAVSGVAAITGVLLDGAPFDQFGVAPPEGGHLDAVTQLVVVAEEDDHGA
jgi:hypothetical protein